MMSDIVARLIDRIGAVHSHYISDDMQLLIDAKAEIERLRSPDPIREEMERLRDVEALYNAGKDMWDPVYKIVLDDRDRLRILNEEMARALERLENANEAVAAALPQSIYNLMISRGMADVLLALDVARRDARAALSKHRDHVEGGG